MGAEAKANEPRKLRIMVVDDDMDLLPMWELTGVIPDTLITIRQGGISALKFLDHFNYELDAVVMDLSMPDMDGITLTKQIRRNEEIRGIDRPMKIFWYTGFPIGDPILTAKKRYRVEEIFVKPAFPVDIVKTVRDILAAGTKEKTNESS